MNIVFETECDSEIKNIITKTYNYAAKHFALPEKTEIVISFLTEEEIRQVNKSSRKTDAVTDVLSFPYLEGIRGKKIVLKEHKTDINPLTKCLMLGEINICENRAKEQAIEYGHSYTRECAYLALHGFLHILGFDHMTESDKNQMRKAEEQILTGLDITR